MKRNYRKLLVAVLLSVCLLLTGCQLSEVTADSENTFQTGGKFTETTTAPDNVTSDFKVHYLDVGQADCILVQNKNENLLIDTGNRDDYEMISDYLAKLSVTKLDYLVLTHPHEDHIGSAANIISNFSIGKVYMTKQKASSKVFSSLMHALKKKSLKYTVPSVGDQFTVGDSTFTFLGPVKKYDDVNEMSLVMRATFGSKSFLFTGDAGITSEKDILSTKATIESDVLKVGHHGSRTSSSYVFLKAVNPVDAIISSGKGNDYGHPHKEALSRLNDVGATTYRTDKLGTIVATCNGKTVRFSEVGTKSSKEHITDENGLEPSKGNNSSNKISTYIGNKNSKVFHRETCSSLPQEKNRVYFATKKVAKKAGYKACGRCKP